MNVDIEAMSNKTSISTQRICEVLGLPNETLDARRAALDSAKTLDEVLEARLHVKEDTSLWIDIHRKALEFISTPQQALEIYARFPGYSPIAQETLGKAEGLLQPQLETALTFLEVLEIFRTIIPKHTALEKSTLATAILKRALELASLPEETMDICEIAQDDSPLQQEAEQKAGAMLYSMIHTAQDIGQVWGAYFWIPKRSWLYNDTMRKALELATTEEDMRRVYFESPHGSTLKVEALKKLTTFYPKAPQD